MQVKVSYLFKLSLLFFTALAMNEIEATVLYKKIDKDGKVIYTDKPLEGAEAITVKTNQNVVSTPRISPSKQQQSQNDDEEQGPMYEVFSIDSPTNDQGIRANDGSVNIVIGITPQIQLNHSIRLHMDGVQVGQDQKIPYFNLANVARGTHELLAMVINDETQEIIQTSKAVTFHVLRPSTLNR